MTEPFAPLDELRSETLQFGRHLLVFFLFVVLLCIATGAFAAPSAASGEECAAAADMAITSRALAEEEIPEDAARKVLERMYPAPMIAKWADAILRAAYTDKRSAKRFAGDLMGACLRSRGDLDGVLGVST